jgi:phosphoglycolate phosphatase
MAAPRRMVVFDVDGTLADSQSEIVQAMAAAFDTVGIKAPTRDAILDIVGLSLPQVMMRLAPNARDGQAAALVEAYKRAYHVQRVERGVSPLYPYAATVVQDLGARDDVVLGVATGKSRRGLDALLAAHQLTECFVTTQVSDNHPSKPAPEMLLAACEAASVAPRHTVMLGDTSYDMQMARAAGAVAIGASWGYHAADQLGDAHMVIDDIRLLPGLLGQIWSQMK